MPDGDLDAAEPDAGDRADARTDAGPGGDERGALTPEEVAYRSFSSARRGISESEVREFLHEVAEELAAAVGRERELLGRIHELEDRIAHPPPPTEDQILDHLGEETARVLRSAQEAADEIRANASARAQAIIEQAEADAAGTRKAADNVLADRSREAEVAAKVIQNEAEGRAQADLRQAARDAEAEIEAARQRGREMVGEARSVRERILADLGKRRSVLQGELQQLEAARAELIEAGRAARANLAGIVDALAAFDEAAEEVTADDAAGAVAGNEEEEEDEEQGADEGEEEEEEDKGEKGEAQEEPGAEAGSDLESTPAPERDEGRPPVAELFARIRADREHAVDHARAVLAVAPEPVAGAGVGDADTEPEALAEDPTGAPAPAEAVDDEVGTGLLARRDELLAPVHDDLVRRCKRALQDEQNELLDRLRRQPGTASAAAGAPEQVLAPLSVQVTDWADVLEPAVDEAYGAGHAVQEPGGAPSAARAPRRLVSGLAEVLVTPLRERLLTTLDAVPGDDGTELASRVGARYREWRSQELAFRVGDVLAAAYARGVYDAAPEGARLQWISAASRCPDCDDNALEPTARGAAFPTGQPFPPAHPGCRCLVAVAED